MQNPQAMALTDDCQHALTLDLLTTKAGVSPSMELVAFTGGTTPQTILLCQSTIDFNEILLMHSHTLFVMCEQHHALHY